MNKLLKCSPAKNLKLPGVIIEPLKTQHAILDFDAIIESKDELSKQYPSTDNWPKNTTFLDNLADLGWHEKEFRDRRSFAYTILNAKKDRCLGCIYINWNIDHAELSWWVRPCEKEKFEQMRFRQSLVTWVTQKWKNVDIKIKDH